MAITTLDEYIAAGKQKLVYTKTTATVTVANSWFDMRTGSGFPSGTTATGNTANGVVPNGTTFTGYPALNTFSSYGYLSIVEYANTIACRMTIYDLLFLAGSYTYNSTVTLSSQPTYSSRVPSSDYTGCQLWVRTVTASSGNPAFSIGFLDQNSSAKTSTFANSAVTTYNRMQQMPMPAGAYGVRQITSVSVTICTTGTYDVMVLRPLWSGRVIVANTGDVHGLDKTGMPTIYSQSAIGMMMNTDATASGVPELFFEICN